jgi:hypothetical protein
MPGQFVASLQRNVAPMSAKVSPSPRALMKKGAMVPALGKAGKRF